MEINARDLFNPKPAAMAFDALTKLRKGESLSVHVNPGKAVESLMHLAEREHCKFVLEDEGDYAVVTLTPTRQLKINNPVQEALDAMGITAPDDPLLLIGSEAIGSGNELLGKILLRELIFDFANQEIIPSIIIFYNSGVKLCCEGSPVLDDLKGHVEQGTEILVDAVSLDAYGLTDNVALGEPIQPYIMADLLTQHNGKVISL